MNSIRKGKELQRDWLALVLSIHSKLVRSLEWSGAQITVEQLKRDLPRLVNRVCEAELLDISEDERETLCKAVMSETIGLGPLDVLLDDPIVSDVLVNGFDEVFIEKKGRLIRTPICFANEEHLMRIIQRIASRVGRRIDESSPMVDARLEDGSRVHAVVRPLALHGPTLSIRRFGRNPIGIEQLLEYGAISEEMVQFLKRAVEERIGFLISGGTGAGKTTLLNAVSSFIPRDERIVTIEDAAELKLQHPHVISLETRTSNAEGKGQVSIRDLVRTSLRMRPDRILVGEVRGDEVIDMLQAMNTGHPGSLSTIHANSAKDALARLEIMAGMSGHDLPLPVLRNYITAGIRLLVHVSRLKGGARRVMQISEVSGVEHGEYRLRRIFRFRNDGLDASGNVMGAFEASGYLPRFAKSRKGKPQSRAAAVEKKIEKQINGRSIETHLLQPPTNTRQGTVKLEIEKLDIEEETHLVAAPTRPMPRFEVVAVEVESDVEPEGESDHREGEAPAEPGLIENRQESSPGASPSQFRNPPLVISKGQTIVVETNIVATTIEEGADREEVAAETEVMFEPARLPVEAKSFRGSARIESLEVSEEVIELGQVHSSAPSNPENNFESGGSMDSAGDSTLQLLEQENASNLSEFCFISASILPSMETINVGISDHDPHSLSQQVAEKLRMAELRWMQSPEEQVTDTAFENTRDGSGFSPMDEAIENVASILSSTRDRP